MTLIKVFKPSQRKSAISKTHTISSAGQKTTLNEIIIININKKSKRTLNILHLVVHMDITENSRLEGYGVLCRKYWTKQCMAILQIIVFTMLLTSSPIISDDLIS
jgi:hypothetical protein